MNIFQLMTLVGLTLLTTMTTLALCSPQDQVSCATANCDFRNSHQMTLAAPSSPSAQWNQVPKFGSQSYLGCSTNGGLIVCLVNDPKAPIVALNASGSILWTSTGQKHLLQNKMNVKSGVEDEELSSSILHSGEQQKKSLLSKVNLKFPPVFFGNRGPGFIVVNDDSVIEMDVLSDIRFSISAKPGTAQYPVITDDEEFLVLGGGNLVWSILLGQGTTFASLTLGDYLITGTPGIIGDRVYYPAQQVFNGSVTDSSAIFAVQNNDQVMQRMQLKWNYTTSGTIYYSPLIVGDRIIVLEKTSKTAARVFCLQDSPENTKPQLLFSEKTQIIGQLLLDPICDAKKPCFWICDSDGCEKRDALSGAFLTSWKISDFSEFQGMNNLRITGPVTFAKDSFLMTVSNFDVNKNKEEIDILLEKMQTPSVTNKVSAIAHESFLVSLAANQTTRLQWKWNYSTSSSSETVSFGQKIIAGKTGAGYTNLNVVFSTFGGGIHGVYSK